MDDELDTTNQGEDAEVLDPGVEAEVQADEPQFDDDGNPIEDQADAEEEDELDIGGHKLKLPKSVAERLNAERLMQSDYTKKTQELAEQRKAFEAERQAVTQADEQELTARGNLTLINQQIAQYSKVDWNNWHDQDPFAAQKAFQQFQFLKDAKNETTNYLSALRQQRATQEQQDSAKRMEEGRSTLVKAIPEWSPAYSAKLFDDAQKTFGLTPDDLDGISDPRVIIVLDAAVRGRALMSGQKKAQALQQQQKVVPAAKAASGGNPVPPGKLDDRLSAEAWVKRRNEQLRKRA